MGNGAIYTGIIAVPTIGIPGGALISNSLVDPADVFVTKLDPTGKVLFTAIFAGKGVDFGRAVTVDPAGNVYVAGSTTSNDYPLSNALQSKPGKFQTGFITKLSADGRTILYSTYFGGVSGSTTINAMTADAAGNLYLTGLTSSADFPVTKGMPKASVSQPDSGSPNLVLTQTVSSAFITSIAAAGDQIRFSGTVGGVNGGCSSIVSQCALSQISTTGMALALDRAQNVYFAGNTNAVDLPTTSGVVLAKGVGGFVGKIAAGGTGLAYLTYLSSAVETFYSTLTYGATTLQALTADLDGNVYLGGVTGDPKFPVTPGAFQTTFAGGPLDSFGFSANTDGFVAKLNPTGTAFVWASYLGGTGDDSVKSIALDSVGTLWAAGKTASPTFPNSQGWSRGGDFLVGFTPTGAALQFSARYPDQTVAQAVSVDGAALIHAAGSNGIVSTIAATSSPSAKIFGVANVIGGLLAGRVAPAEIISIYGPNIGPPNPVSATPSNGFFPTTLGSVQVMVGGIAAPLLYVSAGQINAVVPMGVTVDAASTIQITSKSGATQPYPLWVDASDGQIFPGVLNQDGTLNSETNPAKLGTVISFYATGFQNYFESVMDGQIVQRANNYCSKYGCGGFTGTILYLGPAPGLVAGVTQVNLRLDVSGPNAVSVSGVSQETIYLDFPTGLAFSQVWLAP